MDAEQDAQRPLDRAGRCAGVRPMVTIDRNRHGAAMTMVIGDRQFFGSGRRIVIRSDVDASDAGIVRKGKRLTAMEIQPAHDHSDNEKSRYKPPSRLPNPARLENHGVT
ncbi:MAG TPA: hypothetical protein VL899_10250 [Alphaproteobacteria bacterium]|jgi:hypothetical protein|nr:hypothetical protein [Alphaproteobacteria bacterium]